MLHFLIVFWVA